MEMKVLGPGCVNCHKMEELARKAVKELGIEARLFFERIPDETVADDKRRLEEFLKKKRPLTRVIEIKNNSRCCGR